MLKQIRIQGYKCLKKAEFEVSNLNIFAGPNSSGKSSTIQALLLLRQSGTEGGIVPALGLSGELYEGGTAADVLHPEANYRIDCSITNDSRTYEYQFARNREVETETNARSLPTLISSCTELAPELKGNDFIYLNAERSRPKAFFDIPSDRVGLAGKLGKHGEFTVAQLARASSGTNVVDWGEHSSELQKRLITAPKILDRIDLSDEVSKSGGRIDLVTKEILSWIMPGAYFDATESIKTDAAVLEFVRDRGQTAVRVRPTHMGFGLTYALPIIASGFFTPPGGLIIVENPEAHLHPFSQSRLGVFLAIIAASGRQLLVETHSDHFVNGVRIAIKAGLVSPQQLKIHFFRPPTAATTSNVVGIDCDENGRLSEWPDGFFDQIESDLSKI